MNHNSTKCKISRVERQFVGSRRRLIFCSLVLSVLLPTSLSLSGCAQGQMTGERRQTDYRGQNQQSEYRSQQQQTQQPQQPYSPDTVGSDAPAINAQAQQLIKAEITFTAPVKKLLPADTRGLPHQKFLLELSNGTTILVAHNTRMAPEVPISAGSLVTIKGEYIWNRKGGLMHWTHHTDTPNHEGGYIDFNGKRYE